MVESPSKSSINKVMSGRITKPARSNRAKVSYTESGDDDDDSDPVIKSEQTSFAVQQPSNGTSSYATNMTANYGAYSTHHGYDNGHGSSSGSGSGYGNGNGNGSAEQEEEQFFGAVEELNDDFGDV
jgi:hypothetical protein